MLVLFWTYHLFFPFLSFSAELYVCRQLLSLPLSVTFSTCSNAFTSSVAAERFVGWLLWLLVCLPPCNGRVFALFVLVASAAASALFVAAQTWRVWPVSVKNNFGVFAVLGGYIFSNSYSNRHFRHQNHIGPTS